MGIVLYTDQIEAYLKRDSVIDHDSTAIRALADALYKKSDNEVDFIRRSYEFVRDSIAHSGDIKEDTVTCTASEVLHAGHGICFAKSHLLAAILRCRSVPAGFCYQKLILNDETAPVLIYHGLNGVYVRDYEKWIRLDARGNTNGIHAQFSIKTEQLAFPIRPDKGERDGSVIYPDPDAEILEKMRKNKSRAELWEDLPMTLGYEKQHGTPDRKTAIL